MNLDSIEAIMCNDCGINFAIEKVIVNSWRKHKKVFLCPNGHQLTFNNDRSNNEKELDNLRGEVKKLKDNLSCVEEENKELKQKIAELNNELEIWRPSSDDNKS